MEIKFEVRGHSAYSSCGQAADGRLGKAPTPFQAICNSPLLFAHQAARAPAYAPLQGRGLRRTLRKASARRGSTDRSASVRRRVELAAWCGHGIWPPFAACANETPARTLLLNLADTDRSISTCFLGRVLAGCLPRILGKREISLRQQGRAFYDAAPCICRSNISGGCGSPEETARTQCTAAEDGGRTSCP